MSGRANVVANRKALKKARVKLAGLPAHGRNELQFNGIGPGDSYFGTWRMINRYRHKVMGYETMLTAPAASQLTPNDRRRIEEDIRYYSEQIIHMYRSLLPHEKARLATIEVKGDPSQPQGQVDLSGLADEDLFALARILPKIGGPTAGGGSADQPGAGTVEINRRPAPGGYGRAGTQKNDNGKKKR